MNLKQILYAGILYTVLAFIVNTAESALTIGYYTNPAYSGLWSAAMMPTNGPPPLSFFVISIVFNLIVGIILAWFYSVVSNSISGNGAMKGLRYGGMLFLVAGVPFTLTLYLLLAIPTTLLFWWTASALIVYLLAGIIFEKIVR